MWNTHVSQQGCTANRTNLKSNSCIRPGGAVTVTFLQESGDQHRGVKQGRGLEVG